MSVWVRISDNLVLHQPSGVYYARKFRAGKGSFFKTTGERRKGIAQSKANEMIAAWLAGSRAKINSTTTLSVLCDRLLVELEEDVRNGDRAQKTFDAGDKVYLPFLKKHFGDCLPADIDEAYWDNWIRTTGKRLNRTLDGVAKYLSLVLTYAHELKLLSRKPKIRNPDPKKKSVKTFTQEQIRDLAKVLSDSKNPKFLDIYDLLIIAAENGPRPYESRKLEWSMVTIGKTVIIDLPDWRVKTRRGRQFAVGPRSSEVLRRRFRVRNKKSPFVFPSDTDPMKPINEVTFSKRWRKAVALAGLPKGIKFHWLRHTFFTRALLEAGKELPMVAAYGGNSPKILFDRYLAKEASRTKEMAGAVSLDLDSEE